MVEARAGAQPVFRVILRMDVRPGMEPEFERTWVGIAEAIAGHPANLGQSLMRGCDGESVYYVTSDWRDEPAFRAFERGPAHREHRRRLDALRSGGWMVTAQVLRAVPGQAMSGQATPSHAVPG